MFFAHVCPSLYPAWCSKGRGMMRITTCPSCSFQLVNKIHHGWIQSFPDASYFVWRMTKYFLGSCLQRSATWAGVCDLLTFHCCKYLIIVMSNIVWSLAKLLMWGHAEQLVPALADFFLCTKGSAPPAAPRVGVRLVWHCSWAWHWCAA